MVARTQRIAVTTNSDSLPTFVLISWDQYARTRPPTRPSGKIGTPLIRNHRREMRTATTENPAPWVSNTGHGPWAKRGAPHALQNRGRPADRRAAPRARRRRGHHRDIEGTNDCSLLNLLGDVRRAFVRSGRNRL